MSKLHELSLLDLGGSLKSRELNTEEVVNYFQERISKYNSDLNAFIDTPIQLPGDLDVKKSTLSGIPFATKDNIVSQGHPARAASKVLEGFTSPYTATVLQKLLSAHAIVLGRTNCDEFAMGTSTENSAYGPTKNPWDTSRIPGGSSGGSAAAVAAGLIPYALGSDTGGSIRQPAAMCGVVGVKPTYGRVSRYGLIALASSFDTIGPLARSVEDAAIILENIAGFDEMDSTTVKKDVPKYSDFVHKGISGMRIGVPKEYFIKGMQSEVEDAVREAIKKFELLGAEIVEVSLPSNKYGIAAYYVILPVEVSANLSRYDGIRYQSSVRSGKALDSIYKDTRGQGLGPEPKRRVMLGTYASSSGYYDAYYKQALNAQNFIKNEFKAVFEKVDCLITPTAPTTAFKIGEKSSDPLQLYLEDVFTVGANISGVPAISLPCGQDSKGLPIGLQVIAPWFKEELMFQVAGAYENSTEWSKLKPKIWHE